MLNSSYRAKTNTVFGGRKMVRHNLRVANADDWVNELVRRTGQAIKTARGGRSAAWLSDRTDELGYRVSPTVIAKLDSGHRGGVLSVVELLVIAAALDVPPVSLLYPDLPDGDVEVLPGEHMSSIGALLRFTGEGDTEPTSDIGRLGKLSRELFKSRLRHSVRLEILDGLMSDISPDQASDDQLEQASELISRLIDKADEVRDLERQISRIPGAVLKGGEGDS